MTREIFNADTVFEFYYYLKIFGNPLLLLPAFSIFYIVLAMLMCLWDQ